MFLKMQKRSLAFLLALVLLLSAFMTVAVFPASAAEADDAATGNGAYYGLRLDDAAEVQFTTLTDAIDAAQDSSATEKVITLLQDVDYTENCTIPAGVTLLIPFDNAHTVYRMKAGLEHLNDAEPKVIPSYTPPSSYCTMTMQPGSSLTVNGELSVSSQLSSVGDVSDPTNNWNGSPTGPGGRIKMLSDSHITVNNGGALYAWGYIWGTEADPDGAVIINDGATVYEAFQIKNYRGFGQSMDAVNHGSFFFNQYYVQNVEVPMKVFKGASEFGFAALNKPDSNLIVPISVAFIGEDGLFVMTENDGYLIKDYIEQTDRLEVKIYGDSQLSSLSLSLASYAIDSSNFVLPITNNITVEAVSGDLEITQNISMLPGTEMKIDEGSTMTISEEASIYVCCDEDWNGEGYVSGDPGTNFISVGYTAAADGDPNIRAANPADAKIDINGAVVVNGGFYASATNKPDISSSEGTGTITYATDAQLNKELKEYNGSAASGVAYIAAAIKNQKGEYVSPVIYDDDIGPVSYVVGEYNYSKSGDEFFETMYWVKWLNMDEQTVLYANAYKLGQTPVYGGPAPVYMQDKYSFTDCVGWSYNYDAEDDKDLIQSYQFVNGDPEIQYHDVLPAVDEVNFDENNEIKYYAIYSPVKHSLSLNGSIDVNFYLWLGDENYPINKNGDFLAAEGFTAEFSWGKKFISSKTYSDELKNTKEVSGSPDGYHFVKFTLPLAAKELNDEITVTFKQNGQVISEQTYSGDTYTGSDYAYRVLGMSDEELSPFTASPAALKELVRTMLVYSADAQTYFNYNTNSLATARLSAMNISTALTPVDTTKLRADKYPEASAFDGLTFFGSALNLESETGYTLYFDINNPSGFEDGTINVNAATTDILNNSKNLTINKELVDKSKKLRISMKGLAAAEITRDIKLTYKDTEITVNPGEYIALALEHGNASLKNTVTALYNYNQAAIAFFGGN